MRAPTPRRTRASSTSMARSLMSLAANARPRPYAPSRRRWVIKVCDCWRNGFRKLLMRHEKLECSFVALNHLGAPITAFQRVPFAISVHGQLCGMATRQASSPNMRDGYGLATHWNMHDSVHRSIVALMPNTESLHNRRLDLDRDNTAALVDAFVAYQAIAIAAMQFAREAGALTMEQANNPGAPLLAQADIGVLPDTDTEVISEISRLRADAAQKILPSAILMRMGKVHGHPLAGRVAPIAKHRQRALALMVRAALAHAT